MKRKTLIGIILACILFTSIIFSQFILGNATAENKLGVINPDGIEDVAVNRKIIDLSNETASGSLSVDSDSVVASTNYYQTSSQKIRIKLKSSKSIIVKVSLYDANTEGKPIFEETKELGEIFNTIWTFRDLSNDRTYYFTIENLGQIDVSVTGTVTD